MSGSCRAVRARHLLPAFLVLLAFRVDAAEPAAAAPASAAAPAPAASPAPAAADASAAAVDAYGQLRDSTLESRYEHITAQLRCLVCQNESIADSNVELASDLRRQVREMLVAGRSDADIFQFMTDRYGEFVRFSPPLETKTLFIWGAPFVMLLVGAVIIQRVVRQRSGQPLDDPPAAGASG
jgi:cytochrome c-type biogenesis protein CcmH